MFLVRKKEAGISIKASTSIRATNTSHKHEHTANTANSFLCFAHMFVEVILKALMLTSVYVSIVLTITAVLTVK